MLKRELRRNFFLAFAFSMVSIGVFFESIDFKIPPPYLNISLGIVKDFFDPILIIIFPWCGWVFLIQVCMAVYLKLENHFLILAFLFSSLVMGIFDAWFSFPEQFFLKVMGGVFHYFLIFGLVLIATIFIKAIWGVANHGI